MKKATHTSAGLLKEEIFPECTPKEGTYAVFTVEQTYNTVDGNVMDRFLTQSEKFAYYETLKEQMPEILSYLLDITPSALNRKCNIYRFPNQPYSGGLTDRTFLVYGEEVFPLGSALGGYGVTEFAYMNHNGVDRLYFIFSWGSGILRSHIGFFDFNTKQIFDFGSPKLQSCDVGFTLLKDGQTLGICRAMITKPDAGSVNVRITKGDVLYEDITRLDFAAIQAGR